VLDVVFAEVRLGGDRVARLDQRAPGVVDEALVGGERGVIAAQQLLVARVLHDGQRRLELERAGIRVLTSGRVLTRRRARSFRHVVARRHALV
jgi:hypothetical protein